MGSLISVIVPNREGEAVIGACLESLRGQNTSPHEVIVVDDGSRDRSVDVVKGFGDVKLIALDRSLGYAGACAEGLRHAKGDWIAALNNDAVADPGWIAELLRAAETSPRPGMIASRVILHEPAGKVDSLGIGFSRGALCLLRGHLQDDLGCSGAGMVQVPGPAGSAAMYSRDLIEDAGFFEPDFFAYYEDADLCLRARWRGYFCLLADRARVTHRHSFTAVKVGLAKRRLIQRNRLRTIVRNWPRTALIRDFPWIQGASVAGCVRALIEGEPMAAVKARIDHFGFLKKDLAVREETMKKASIADEAMSAWLRLSGGPG